MSSTTMMNIKVFEILKGLQASADSPTELGKYVALKISELLTCKHVVLLQHVVDGEEVSHSVLALHSFAGFNGEIPYIHLAQYAYLLQASVFIHQQDIPQEIRQLLAFSEIKNIIITPIEYASRRIGTIVCLNVDENIDADALLSALNILSVSIAFQLKIEKELKESEIRYRTLADSGLALVWTSGLDKKCNYFNKVWLNFTGRSLEEELGDGWTENVHPDDFNYCVETYISAFDLKNTFLMTYRLKRFDGMYRWILDEGQPMYNSDNEFIGYIGHCLDITELKQAENEVIESEERLKNAQEIAKLGSWELDVKKQKGRWSDQMFLILGLEIGKNPPDLETYLQRIHPDDRALVTDAMEQMFKGNTPVVAEFRTNPTYGAVKILLPSWQISYDLDGQIGKFSGTVIDITERKHAEELAKESERRFTDIMKSVNLVSIVLDKTGRLSFCNDYFLAITGYKYHEVIGLDWFKTFIPAEINDDVYLLFKKSIHDKKVVSYHENEIVIKSGNRINIAWNNTIMRDSNGFIIGLASLGEDITMRKQTEKQNKEQLEELKRWYSVTLDRESRVMELKQEVNSLLTKMGEQPRYIDYN